MPDCHCSKQYKVKKDCRVLIVVNRYASNPRNRLEVLRSLDHNDSVRLDLVEKRLGVYNSKGEVLLSRAIVENDDIRVLSEGEFYTWNCDGGVKSITFV